MSSRHLVLLFFILIGFLLPTSAILAQTASSSLIVPPPIIAKLSTASTTPGAWVSIVGTGLSRAQVFVDNKKVPLANLIFSDAAGREIRYRVQDLTAGSHNIYVTDSAGKQPSRLVVFTVSRPATSVAVAPAVTKLVKYVKVVGLDAGNGWRAGAEKTVSWLALGTGEIDILLCRRATPVSCTTLASKTANDGVEIVKLPLNTKIGKVFITVRKYNDDTVKGVTPDFVVATPSAFMQGKVQLASAWEAIQGFLLKITLGQ